MMNNSAEAVIPNTGQTYEHGDIQLIPPVDDRIADLAQSLCNEHRRILDQFCKLSERSTKLLALEAALRERRGSHE